MKHRPLSRATDVAEVLCSLRYILALVKMGQGPRIIELFERIEIFVAVFF